MLQDSARVRSNWDGNNLRKGEHVAQSSIWRGAALSLMTLCLLLVAGLVTLGIIYSEKLNQLQKIIHPQQDNLSEPLNISRNGPSEEYLQSQISALLERQEQMATKLCKEFLIHTSDHKCNPCPKSWQWHGNSCYYFTIHEEKTWSDSRKDCTDKNATLVKIDSFREREIVSSNQQMTSHVFCFLPPPEFPSVTTITPTLFLLAGIVLELNWQALGVGRWFNSLSNLDGEHGGLQDAESPASWLRSNKKLTDCHTE
ncbi:C-type lectin domain family 12 member B [Cricetulus griseus]